MEALHALRDAQKPCEYSGGRIADRARAYQLVSRVAALTLMTPAVRLFVNDRRDDRGRRGSPESLGQRAFVLSQSRRPPRSAP